MPLSNATARSCFIWPRILAAPAGLDTNHGSRYPSKPSRTRLIPIYGSRAGLCCLRLGHRTVGLHPPQHRPSLPQKLPRILLQPLGRTILAAPASKQMPDRLAYPVSRVAAFQPPGRCDIAKSALPFHGVVGWYKQPLTPHAAPSGRFTIRSVRRSRFSIDRLGV
jgi:hypothetical protein